ncbi:MULTISPECIES: hypothetical protein [Sphingomonas]|uniref:hypothetical protein n=1 Tax=Sphingomonas TaxID=13687 RepID=UPI00126A6A91|nr:MULTISPECIES: hypothetical protein [Sphingomonas]
MAMRLTSTAIISASGLTVALLVSSCSAKPKLPADLARSCYAVRLPNGDSVESTIHANVGDILESTLSNEKAKSEVEKTGNDTIFRAEVVDDLTKATHSFALQFAPAGDAPGFVGGGALNSHCGPEKALVVRGVMDGNELNALQLSALVGTLVSASKWRTEAQSLSEKETVSPKQDEAPAPAPVPELATEASSTPVKEASDHPTCLRKWIYSPNNFDTSVGIGLELNQNGKFVAQFSDYDRQNGEWSVNGRVSDGDKIILDDFGTIHDCQATSATLDLQDGRTFKLKPLVGDASSYWQKHGWTPE